MKPLMNMKSAHIRANLAVRIMFARTCCCPVWDNRSFSGSLREDLLELRFGDSEERSVLTRAKARVATTDPAGQQRLLTYVVELLELRQDHFITVPVDGENLHRTPDDHVGAVAGFAFPEDERRGWELDDLGDRGKRADLAGLEIVEQSQALEELFAFRRIHHSFRLQGQLKPSKAGRLVSPHF